MTPLLFARNTISPAIHFNARAIVKEELGLGATGHLAAINSAITLKLTAVWL